MKPYTLHTTYYILKLILCLLLAFMPVVNISRASDEPTENQQLLDILDTAIQNFWGTRGQFEHIEDGTLVGWAMEKTVDEPLRWEVDDDHYPNQPVISIMEPGVNGVGLTFLEAYKATGNKLYLEYALEAGKTLLSIQRDLEITPNGAERSEFFKGGFISHTVIIPESAGLGNETGHWGRVSIASEDEQAGTLRFNSTENEAIIFDDRISTNGAMFLLELCDTVKDLDFSNQVIDPLRDIEEDDFLEGATKFFDLVEAYRNDFVLDDDDFNNFYVSCWDDHSKDGDHPFKAYLEGIEDQSRVDDIRNGAYKPYQDGGFPYMAADMDTMLQSQGNHQGSLAAGYPLHKTLNDNVLSGLMLFLLRYYEVTGEILDERPDLSEKHEAALENLNTQINYLIEVFQKTGSRSWCQQYHVLDDQPAGARPFEPPAFSMSVAKTMVNHLGLIEKTMEEEYGQRNDDVRKMLEQALYYMHEVVTPDEENPKKLFSFYALEDYDLSRGANTYIQADAPFFSWDYFYPDNPYLGDIPGWPQGYKYYLIDESGGEFITPLPTYGLCDISIPDKDAMIDNDYFNTPNYQGGLDFDTEYAGRWNYWQIAGYWSSWSQKNTAREYLNSYPLTAEGFWTSESEIAGETRTVIDTAIFKARARGIAHFLGRQNGYDIVDSDSDGLSNNEENQVRTDPFYPDSDKDGLLDGEDPYPLWPSSDILGDVTGNGLIEINDVQACVNIILFDEIRPDWMERADISGETTGEADGAVNIYDLQALVNMVLSS